MIDYGLKVIQERDCFVKNGSYFAARIKVFEDGTVDCWGRMDKSEFIEKAKSGWITVDIPDGESLRICNQDLVVKQEETLNPDGTLMFKHKWITQEEFIKDILDSIYVAQGNKTASELCQEAYEACLKMKSADNLRILVDRYLEVPKHNRCFILGDQDLKDFPIVDMIEYAGRVMAISGIQMEKIRKEYG